MSNRLADFQEALSTAAKIRSDLRAYGISIDDKGILALLKEAEAARNGSLFPENEENPKTATEHESDLAKAVAAQETWFQRILVVLEHKGRFQKTRQVAEALQEADPKARGMSMERLRGRVYTELARILKRQKAEHQQGGPEPHIRLRQGKWAITDAGRKALAEEEEL